MVRSVEREGRNVRLICPTRVRICRSVLLSSNQSLISCQSLGEISLLGCSCCHRCARIGSHSARSRNQRCERRGTRERRKGCRATRDKLGFKREEQKYQNTNRARRNTGCPTASNPPPSTVSHVFMIPFPVASLAVSVGSPSSRGGVSQPCGV